MLPASKLVPIALLISGLGSLLLFPRPDIFVPANDNFSTAQIALEEHWIKGAAPILAAEFDTVKISYVNKDVEDSFVFDIALGQIYGIDADYTLPPLDVRGLNLSEAIAASTKERSEIFCNHPGEKYCELALVWDASADKDVELIALRIEDSLYALVEQELAISLGVTID